MKIILTPAELTTLVAYRYQIPVDTALTVEVAAQTDSANYALLADQIVLAHYREGHLTVDGDIRPDKKISAIKLLRTQIPNTGLANAKHAVENWKRFILHIRNNGIPNLNSDLTSFPWVQPSY